VGRPFEMYEHPNGRFSSTFLGKANVVEGRHDGHGVDAAGLRLPCDPDSPSGPVDYIVRPEKLSFARGGAAALVRGRVSARVFLGNHWLFQIDTALGPMQVTTANAGLPEVAEGEDVGLVWSAANARVVPRGA